MNIDDLLFENRNKEYGAYALRKHYKKTLIISLVISTIIFLIIFIIPFLIYLNKQYSEDYIIRTRIVTAQLMPIENINIPKKEKSNLQQKKESPAPEPIKDEKNLSIKDTTLKDLNNKDSSQNKDISNIAGSSDDEADAKNALFICGGDLNSFRFWFTDNYDYKILKGNKKGGKVVAQFSVNTKGYIDSVTIIAGINPAIDNEVKRVLLNAPRWKPCIYKGHRQRMQYLFPIFVSK